MLCFRKTRGFAGMAFYFWSLAAGLQLWLASLLVVLELWGIVAAIIGLCMAGVGVLPIALVASLFKAEWSIFFQLLLSFGMMLTARIGGMWLAERAAEREAMAQIEAEAAQVETIET